MLTIPNIISLLRFPLTLAFMYHSPVTRSITIALVGLTDFLDGYLARRCNQYSRIGTVLDPVADKFFVIVALGLFFYEGKISLIEISAMLCRDFSVIVFGLYLIVTRNFSKYHYRAIWCGKITTTFQLLTLGALTLDVFIPSYFYGTFVLLGLAALLELYLSDHTFIPPELRKKKKSEPA